MAKKLSRQEREGDISTGAGEKIVLMKVCEYTFLTQCWERGKRKKMGQRGSFPGNASSGERQE